MRTRFYRFAIVSGLLFLGGVSGCQFSYPFEISGFVQSAADDTPLPGVTIALKADGLRGESPFPLITGEDGKFRAAFRVGDIAFTHGDLPKWTLVLSKDGYQNQTLEIRFTQKPESTSKTTTIPIEGRLKPK